MAGDVRDAPPPPGTPADWSVPGPPRRGVVDLQSLNAAGALTAPDDVARWREAEPVVRPTRVGRVRLATEVADVRPWSAEVPSLYRLEVRLVAPDGTVAERVERRIGFRRVEVRGVELLVNGRAVLIRGVNRHDFDPRTGRVVAPEDMRADVVAMKRWGFNAVRSSHYPNDPAFLDACDELGLYVIDEADIESHGWYEDVCRDPRYRSAFVDRVARMIERDRHHPSIIAWSLGNESGYGPNHDAAAGWARVADPSRPLHYEGAIKFDWSIGGDRERPPVPDVPADRLAGGPRALGGAAPPAGDVRVQPRDGQQQRDPGRVLGRDRVDARAPGRLHLGVARPRPRAAAPGRDDPPRLRRRLRRPAQRRRVLHRRHHVPRPEPEAGHLRAHVPRLPRPRVVGRGGDRGRARGPGHAREPGRVPRHRVAPGGLGGLGRRRGRRVRGPAAARDRAGRHRRGRDPGLPPPGRRRRRALADAALPHGRGRRLGGGRPRDRLGAGAAGRRGTRRRTRHPGCRTTSGLDRRRRARRRGVPPPPLVRGAAGPVPLARPDRQRPDRRDGGPLGGAGACRR